MDKETLQHALEWNSLGISTIPIYYKTKVPIYKWTKWRTVLPSIKTIEDWFSKRVNIAVLCGTTNLSVIDFDNMDYYNSWLDQAITRQDEWADVAKFGHKVFTSRGIHVYLRTSAQEHKRIINYPGMRLDIESEGGFVIAPPSVHPNGHVYTGLNPKNIITVRSTYDMFPQTEEEKEFSHYSEPKVFDPLSDFPDDENSLVHRVKEKINILDFVSQFTKMRKTSNDGSWWLGRCIHPNHADKNPSFRVNVRTERAKCFSTNCAFGRRSHDVIGLNMIMHNLIDYIQSAEMLAQTYHII